MFEYCHASVIWDNIDVLYLEDGMYYRPFLKKNQTANLCFFSEKPFVVLIKCKYL